VIEFPDLSHARSNGHAPNAATLNRDSDIYGIRALNSCRARQPFD
jgi:hypothetical protein